MTTDDPKFLAALDHVYHLCTKGNDYPQYVLMDLSRARSIIENQLGHPLSDDEWNHITSEIRNNP